jgi:ABC-type glycerol-3-phosphate transport system permease component
MMIFLAGLQGVPQELYDAADIDGAGAIRRFRHITLPMISPTMFFNLVLGVIAALKVFTVAFIATGGGPAYSTWFIALHIWSQAFKYLEMGYASALAWIFTLVVLVLTIGQFRSRHWVHMKGGGQVSSMLAELADERISASSAEHGGRQHRVRTRVLLHALTVTLALFALFPFIWTVASSLKTPAELVLFPPPLFPYTPQWGNYLELWRVVPFGAWLLNSLIFTIVGTFGAVASATLVAYSFARFRYPGRDVFFIITLATIMLPVEVTIIPQYILFFNIGWIDTLLPLIVPQWLGGGAFIIFLIRQFASPCD